MTSFLLLAGLVAVFAGVLGIVTVSIVTWNDRHDAARRASLLASISGSHSLRDLQLRQPFRERVLDPAAERLSGLGRTLTPKRRQDHVQYRLVLAGSPAGWDVDRVLGAKAFGLIAAGAVGALAVPALGLGARWMLLIPTLAVLGWFVPSMWIYQLGYERTERLRRELPDALDLLTISVEAGLSFDAALAQVARRSKGPLAVELFRVLQEVQIGTGRMQALRAMAERTDVEELRVFVGALVQAETFGIPVAGVLRVQAKEMRLRRSQRAEEKAQQVPVKILFPLIFCIMPALFVVVMGPAAIRVFVELRGL